MNFAAVLPDLAHVGFQWRIASPRRKRAGVAGPAQRTLSRNAILTLENSRLQLRVLRGCVWITRDGCPADTMLHAGGVFEQRVGAPVLLQALEETEIVIAGSSEGLLTEGR